MSKFKPGDKVRQNGLYSSYKDEFGAAVLEVTSLDSVGDPIFASPHGSGWLSDGFALVTEPQTLRHEYFVGWNGEGGITKTNAEDAKRLIGELVDNGARTISFSHNIKAAL